MSFDYRSFFRSIQRIIEQEIRLQEAVLTALKQEQISVVAFSDEKLQKSVIEASQLIDKTQELASQRKALMESLPELKPLTQLLKEKGQAQERRSLLPLILKLKRSVRENARFAKEVSLLSSFANQVAGSLIGIIHSGRHGVSKRYTGTGTIQETYHPAGTRASAVIKKA